MKSRIESLKGGIWLTSGGRIVLDDHGNETYFIGADRKLMTKKELTNGIKLDKFLSRLEKAKKKVLGKN